MEQHPLGHNPVLSWGQNNRSSSSGTWAPVNTRSSKRPMSDSDDCEDVFSEESSKDQCTSPSDADSCQMLSRKKRRGVIEKKRRDRINTSLTELKRLVPSAYEKQGSAKLEKAEILQMTVDHLKMIHSKGLDVLSYDPHKFAMDYHNIGFRECATEVARYLVTIEGMDVQDPLRVRLLSHLQCFVAQREIAASGKVKPTTSWGYPTSVPNYPAARPPTPGSNIIGNLDRFGTQQSLLPPPPLHHQTHDINNHLHYTDISTSCAQPTIVASSVANTHSRHLEQLPSSSNLTSLTSTTTTSLPYHGGPHQYNNAFPPVPTSSNTSNLVHLQNYNQANSSANMKPYRPWGAEVAY